MVNYSKFFISCLGILILTGCSHQTVDQSVINKQSCIALCQKHLEACRKNCQDSCVNCVASANRHMARRYNKYMHEEWVQGKVVTRELQSYRDPLQCRKNTCNCRVDYTICTQSCNGTIYKRLQRAPICC